MSITKRNKERISISIDPETLALLDKTVDGEIIASRSEAVEKIIQKYVSESKKCVILTGGPSSNLKVGSTYRPLVKLKDKTLIDILIAKVRKAGSTGKLLRKHPMMSCPWSLAMSKDSGLAIGPAPRNCSGCVTVRPPSQAMSKGSCPANWPAPTDSTGCRTGRTPSLA